MKTCIVGFNTRCLGNENAVKIAWLAALRHMLSLPLELIHVEVCCLLEKKSEGVVQIGIDAEEYYRIKDSEKEANK